MDCLEKIKLTIVIPTYNRKILVRKCVESILNQNSNGFQLSIVVVDDGSTDQTEQHLNDLIQSKKIHFHRIKNSERGFARNFGAHYALKNLSPDYFIFFDADDILVPTALDQFHLALSKLTDADVLFARYQILEADEALGRTSPVRKNNSDFKKMVIYKEPIIPLGCTLLKSKTFSETNGFNEDRNLSGSEDWLFLFQIILKYQVISLDFVTTLYRQHAGNTHSNQFDRSLNYCLQFVEERSKAWALDEKQVLGLKKQFIYNQIGAHNSDRSGKPFFHLKKMAFYYPLELLNPKFYKYFLSVIKNKLIH